MTAVENAVPTEKFAVGRPSKRVGEFVRVVAAEAGDDDFARVGLAVAVEVLHKQDVGTIGDPNAAETDRDAGRDVQTVGENGEFVGFAVAVGVFKNLDAIATGTGRLARIFETLGDPKSTFFVDRHGHRIDDVRLGGDQLDDETRGNFHPLDRLARR